MGHLSLIYELRFNVFGPVDIVGVSSILYAGIKLSQKLPGYFHSIHAIIALVDIFCQASHYYNCGDSQLGRTDDEFSPSLFVLTSSLEMCTCVCVVCVMS